MILFFIYRVVIAENARFEGSERRGEYGAETKEKLVIEKRFEFDHRAVSPSDQESRSRVMRGDYLLGCLYSRVNFYTGRFFIAKTKQQESYFGLKYRPFQKES